MSAPGEWAQWESADHISEAQRLCELAVLPDQSDAASAIYLKTAHVHSMIAIAARMDEVQR